MSKINILGVINRYFQSDGTPLAAGTIEIFDADGTFNTANYKNSYQESSLTTVNANPVVLDSGGAPDTGGEIWVDGDCDVRVKNSAGTVIDTIESANPQTSSTGETTFNLVANGGFESPASGDGLAANSWTSVIKPGTGEIDNSDHISGTQCYLFTSTGTGGQQIISEDFKEVTEGQLYDFTFWIKCTAADVRNLVEVVWYDSAQSQLSSDTVYDESTSNPTSWTQKRALLSPPASSRYMKVRIYGCHSSDSTSGSTRIDDIVMTYHNFTPDIYKGADIASASTLTLGTDGNRFDVTGTTAITAISGDQSLVVLQFDGALTLTHHSTNLILPSGANITTAAGDRAILVQYATDDWECISYSKANGEAVTSFSLTAGSINDSSYFSSGVVDQAAIGANAVGQSELKATGTASQSVSMSSDSTTYSIALTGGDYTLVQSAGNSSGTTNFVYGQSEAAPTRGTVYAEHVTGGAQTFYCYSSYVSASPPYGTADGQIPLFIYVEIENVTGNILGVSVAKDPHWAYHGPTDIRGKRQADGRIIRSVRQIEAEIGRQGIRAQRKAALISGNTAMLDNLRTRLATDPMVDIEITQDYKNTDMNTHPHCWMDNPVRASEFALLDPQNTLALMELMEDGEDILKLVEDGTIIIDNTPLNRIVPTGMKAYGFRF